MRLDEAVLDGMSVRGTSLRMVSRELRHCSLRSLRSTPEEAEAEGGGGGSQLRAGDRLTDDLRFSQ